MWNSARFRVVSGMAMAIGLVVAIGGSSGCSVDKSFYSDRLYACDVSSSDTSACGPGYGCYGGARQLGSIDFCAPACTESSNDTACSSDNLSLRRCSPAQSGSCPTEMACIRTNVFGQEGVCLPMRACSERTDCRDPVRSECLSAVFRDLKSYRPDAQNDHMHCIQAACEAGGEACSPATTCLQTALKPLGDAVKALFSGYATTEEERQNAIAALDASIRSAGDFCAPNCDAAGNCPPSFVCSDKIFPFWQSKARFCLPGDVGTICESDRDCMVGKCQLDHNICAAPCTSNGDCQFFGNGDSAYTCVGGVCKTDESRSCNLKHGCPTGQTCVFGTCAAGLLGFPCTNNSECAASVNLSCYEVTDSAYKQCTRKCFNDTDCPNFLSLNSYCDIPRTPTLIAVGGYCKPGKRPQSN